MRKQLIYRARNEFLEWRFYYSVTERRICSLCYNKTVSLIAYLITISPSNLVGMLRTIMCFFNLFSFFLNYHYFTKDLNCTPLMELINFVQEHFISENFMTLFLNRACCNKIGQIEHAIKIMEFSFYSFMFPLSRPKFGGRGIALSKVLQTKTSIPLRKGSH